MIFLKLLATRMTPGDKFPLPNSNIVAAGYYEVRCRTKRRMDKRAKKQKKQPNKD
jgi:hypothetical protein